MKIKKNTNFRAKVHADKGDILAFDDILCLPGFTNFDPNMVNISTTLGPYEFKLPIISAAMDTITEEKMAIAMALNGGLGVIHRNTSYENQLKMVKRVKRARSFIIDDVSTLHPSTPISEMIAKMRMLDISGFVVVDDDNKVVGIVTSRDLPFHSSQNGKTVLDIMTKNPICLPSDVSRNEALDKLYEIRKEKIPLTDKDGTLRGLVTKKDLRPQFPNATKDSKGKLVVGLGCSPFLPTNKKDLETLKKAASYADILMTDVAEFYKIADIKGAGLMMETLDAHFVVGNIGTYEAAEYLLTTANFPEDKFIGIKVGMGSGSICTTAIQTGVGAPTLFATAEVADAIKDYNPKIGLIADGGVKYPGDLVKALSVGADMIMSGHFFAGCTETPGYVDTVNGRKVKVYRGMGSAEARSVGKYAHDRYVENHKSLNEGVSGFVPFVGPVSGVLAQLEDGIKNGLIYAGVQDIADAHKIKIGRVTPSVTIESKPHDLIR